MRGCPPNGVETQGVSRRRREDWVFPGLHQPVEYFDQNHEQLQTQVTPTHCFRIVAGYHWKLTYVCIGSTNTE